MYFDLKISVFSLYFVNKLNCIELWQIFVWCQLLFIGCCVFYKIYIFDFRLIICIFGMIVVVFFFVGFYIKELFEIYLYKFQKYLLIGWYFLG